MRGEWRALGGGSDEHTCSAHNLLLIIITNIHSGNRSRRRRGFESSKKAIEINQMHGELKRNKKEWKQVSKTKQN